MLILFFIFYYLQLCSTEKCSERQYKCNEVLILTKVNRTEYSDTENKIRSIIIVIILFYCFIGISVICDKFMSAIEVITSTLKQSKHRAKDGTITVTTERVWNETVSNLTLMALGSSAPEIMLAVIEICTKDFEAGDLGPGTIVGSAAFNLFVICGICIMVIPDGESRKIEHINVFLFTAFSSVFAYIWSYIASEQITKGRIDIWESLVTLALFPFTVLIAYLLDIKAYKKLIKTNIKLSKRGYSRESYLGSEQDINDDNLRKYFIHSFKEIKNQKRSTSRKILDDIIDSNVKGHSRAFYRVAASKQLSGKSNLLNRQLTKFTYKSESDDASNQIIKFNPIVYIVREDIGKVCLNLERSGCNINKTIQVEYETVDGTALGGHDFVAQSGIVEFMPYQQFTNIIIEIINDEIYEEDEYFTVALKNYKIIKSKQNTCSIVFKEPKEATIFIIDDDHPGTFSFGEDEIAITEDKGFVTIPIYRSHGARGDIYLPFKTIEGSAKGNGKDYNDLEGDLYFKDNELIHNIRIRIVDHEEYLKEVYFYVKLYKPYYNPEVKRPKNPMEVNPELGYNKKIKVLIRENPEFKRTIDNLMFKPEYAASVALTSWSDQFHEAFSPISEGDPEDQDNEPLPTILDYFLHFLCLFWKALFAFVPPTRYINGWLTFGFAILWIGALTAVVGDLASLFGCHIGLLDEITSLTLIAMGTSLPDTFASKVAAMNEETADASIGNVTGSNAVNVYLGLGAAWALASIVNRIRGKDFEVQGNMDFSIILYFILSSIGISIILLRRHPYIGGELGGPSVAKYISGIFLFTLYLLFVILCSLRAYCYF